MRVIFFPKVEGAFCLGALKYPRRGWKAGQTDGLPR